MKKIFILTVLLISFTHLYSQSTFSDTINYKNSICIGITPNPFWGFLNINYERTVFQKNKHKISSEAGFGYWQTWGALGTSYKIKINDVYGKKKHHLESGIGIIALYDILNYKIGVKNASSISEPLPSKTDYTNFYIAASFGYLYKNPQKHFIFKAGIAFPESIYFGFGYAF